MAIEYRQNELYCDNQKVTEIAEKYKTPFYLYSQDLIQRGVNVLKRAFKDKGIQVSYALKANPNIHILAYIKSLGLDVDIVSGGELFLAKKAGFEGKQISFAGTGKTEEEIIYALESEIAQFNVESGFELRMLQDIAQKMGLQANVLLRINPNIDAKTHPHISTGLKENKFGISVDEVDDILHHQSRYPNIQFLGLHSHIGSQILTSAPFINLIDFMKNYTDKLKKDDINLTHIDLGGGFGVDYTQPLIVPEDMQFVLDKIGDYAKEQLPNMNIFVQPGRILVGNSGLLVTKVLGEKYNGIKRFYVVDASMTELIRPSLYEAFHCILPGKDSGERVHADVVGPVCESADYFSKNREISKMKQGKILAVGSAGAYASSMNSNYNSRPYVAEYMVYNNEELKIIRKRQSYEQMAELYE